MKTQSETNINLLQSESDLLWNSVPHQRRASVLVILYSNGGELMDCDNLSVVLTVRSSKLRTYPGETAFPGGRCDSDNEGPWDAALREANEEIGFDQHKFQTELLCKLPCFMSRNFLVVRPCVCVVTGLGASPITLKDIAPRLNGDEVEITYSTLLKNFVFGDDGQGLAVLSAVETLWTGHKWVYFEFEIFREGNDDWVFSSDNSDLKNSQSAIISGLTCHMAVDCARIALGYISQDAISKMNFPVLETLGFEPLVRQMLRDRVFDKKARSRGSRSRSNRPRKQQS